jgi:hypothetical protein
MLTNRKNTDDYMLLLAEQELRLRITDRKEQEDYMMLLTEQEAETDAH